MFLAPNFFWGAHPEFLKSVDKIQPDSDHVAKFQGDRSRDLGESVANKKKENITSKTEARPELIVPCGLNSAQVLPDKSISERQVVSALARCAAQVTELSDLGPQQFSAATQPCNCQVPLISRCRLPVVGCR